MTKRWRRTRSRQSGFTAVELLITTSLMSIVGTMAMFEIGSAQPSMKGDSAMRVVMTQLNIARELSITQRRQMEVQFVGTNQLSIVRHEVPAGTTVLSTVSLEGGIRYQLANGLPDTPDAFGHATAVDFGAANKILFNTDGTLIDQAGNPLNGSVFLEQPGQPRSFRAVTVLGGTGRIRGYKWDGGTWVM